MSSVLNTIWEQAKTRLEGIAYYTDAPAVPIIVQDQGDVVNAIDTALSRLGVSVLFLMGGADCNRPNLPGPYLDNISLMVQIAENVVVNRRAAGYKTALEVAENVTSQANGLHLWKPAAINECMVAASDAIRLMEEPPPGASLAYTVHFLTQGGLSLA